MWRFFVPIISLLCCSCSSFEGVGTLSPSQVSDYARETKRDARILNNGRDDEMTAGDYLISSIGLTNQKCHEFFDLLEKFKQDSDFLNKVLNHALSIATTAKAANVAVGLTAATTINLSVADVYTFATLRHQLKIHVQKDQDGYLKKKNLDFGIITGTTPPNSKISSLLETCTIRSNNDDDFDYCIRKNKDTETLQLLFKLRFLRSKSPASLILARDIAAGYAAICSIGHMKGVLIAELEKGIDRKDGLELKVKPGDKAMTTTEVAKENLMQKAPAAKPPITSQAAPR